MRIAHPLGESSLESFFVEVVHVVASRCKVGDCMAQGAVIGLAGATGLNAAPQVHFEVIVEGKAVDPRQCSATRGLERYAVPGADTGMGVANLTGASKTERPQSRPRCSMARSARAVMVSSGLIPRERGMTAPSIT
jgi:hypothetical protein